MIRKRTVLIYLLVAQLLPSVHHGGQNSHGILQGQQVPVSHNPSSKHIPDFIQSQFSPVGRNDANIIAPVKLALNNTFLPVGE